MKLLESPTHSSTSWTLGDPASGLLAHECVDASGTQAAYALWTCVAVFQYAEPPTACTVNLDRVGEHGR